MNSLIKFLPTKDEMGKAAEADEEIIKLGKAEEYVLLASDAPFLKYVQYSFLTIYNLNP